MSTVQMRDAVRGDLPAVIAMLADDFLGGDRGEVVSEPLPESYVAAFTAITEDPRQRLIVAERGGEVLGCYQLTFIPGLSYQGAWKAIIEGVRTRGDLRGTGIGSQMLAHAIDLSREGGARALELTTNKARKDAHRFYAKLGFKNSHEGFKLEL